MGVSENDLTAWFASIFGPVASGEVWTGDDAAVVSTGTTTLVTVDSMSEHVDFELDWATGMDVGHKLVAINVSDIAAMGGRPSHAVATLQMGDDTGQDLVREIATGTAEAARAWDLAIVGGDIGQSTDLVVSLTVLGECDGTPVLRSGARPGDAICVTGSLGAAHAGLMLLQTGAVDLDAVSHELSTGSGADGLAVLAAAQLRPRPRVLEGRALAPFATAMIDVSDGLAADLERICEASGVGCEVRSGSVPLHPDLGHAAGTVAGFPAPLECGLLGGEDLELLFTVDGGRMDDVHRALDEIGTSVSVVGRITEGTRRIDDQPLEELSARAWDHLRTR